MTHRLELRGYTVYACDDLDEMRLFIQNYDFWKPHEEVFLTGNTFGVVPIRPYRNPNVFDDEIGKRYRILLTDYGIRVLEEITNERHI